MKQKHPILHFLCKTGRKSCKSLIIMRCCGERILSLSRICLIFQTLKKSFANLLPICRHWGTAFGIVSDGCCHLLSSSFTGSKLHNFELSDKSCANYFTHGHSFACLPIHRKKSSTKKRIPASAPFTIASICSYFTILTFFWSKIFTKFYKN